MAECFERGGIEMLPGNCDAHRVGILLRRGAWSAGELDARRAGARVERIDLAHVGLAFHEIGSTRLRLGDLDGAETAFPAGAIDRVGHVGSALDAFEQLWLDRRRTDGDPR